VKQSENDQLSKQLDNLVKHQQELEGRTKDLITQARITVFVCNLVPILYQ